MRYLVTYAASVVFTVFDVLGYHYVLTKGETVSPSSTDERAYRIISAMFQVALSIILYELTGIFSVLAFWIMFFFGLDDFLYYVFLGLPFWEEAVMPWLSYTVFGSVLKRFNRKITWVWMVTFALASIPLAWWVISLADKLTAGF